MTQPQPHPRNCGTCKHNNGVEYKHCLIILQQHPKGWQIGIPYAMAIVGCASWQKK